MSDMIDLSGNGPVTECTITVGIVPFRAALNSVVVHADRPKLGDEELTLSRVRLIAGQDELLIVATNDGHEGRTSAQAAVKIEDDDRRVRFEAWDGPFVVDLHPAKIRDISRMLKPVKPLAGEEPSPAVTGWAEVRLRLDNVRVADVSGLWEGQMLRVPTLAHRLDFPDVPRIVGRAIEHAAGHFKPLVAPHGIVSRFDRAAKEWGQELVWEPTGTAESGGWAVMCGPDFAGVAESQHGTGGSLGKRDARKMRHLERAGTRPVLTAL